jgi:hypothetical protein
MPVAITNVAQAFTVHAFLSAAVAVFPARFIVELGTTPFAMFVTKKSHGI